MIIGLQLLFGGKEDAKKEAYLFTKIITDKAADFASSPGKQILIHTANSEKSLSDWLRRS